MREYFEQELSEDDYIPPEEYEGAHEEEEGQIDTDCVHNHVTCVDCQMLMQYDWGKGFYIQDE